MVPARRGLVVVVAVIFGFVANAVAGINVFESCRCGNEIATRGDSKTDVERKCGKPAAKTSRTRSDCGDMWLYNFGRNEFMQGVCFDKSKVKKVLSLDRGY
jgi:hypothetical protein